MTWTLGVAFSMCADCCRVVEWGEYEKNENGMGAVGDPSRSRPALHSPLGSSVTPGRRAASGAPCSPRSGLPRPRGARGPPVPPGRRAARGPQRRVPKVRP